MATDFDRDDRLHGLLRDILRSQPTSGPCIDAATLAAWAEDALTPEETAATDAHLATCARCRELVAALTTLAATEGAPVAGVVPFTPRPNGRWKVIVGTMGAVAASALIWVAVRGGSPSLDTTSAENRSEQPLAMGGSAASPATPPARPAEGANALQPRADAPRDAGRLQGQQGQRVPSTPRPDSKLTRENTARAAEPSQSLAKPSPAPVEPPTRSAAAPPPSAVTAPLPAPPAAPPPAAAVGAARSSTVAGLPQSTTNVAIDPSRNSDLMRASETFFAIPPLPIVAEFVAGADLQAAQGQQGQAFGGVAAPRRAGGAAGGGGGRGGGAAAGVPAQKTADVLSSTEPVRWRLRGSSASPSPSALERSNDSGVTWRAVTLPAAPLLSAGTAPANTVCWLVGRAGTVLLSTDGTTFRQVTKPTDVDLMSVLATDARSATVRTVDGRTFATTDGGVTWMSRSEEPSLSKNLSHEGVKDAKRAEEERSSYLDGRRRTEALKRPSSFLQFPFDRRKS